MTVSFVEAVRKDAGKRILYLPHALDAMNSPLDLITAEEVRQAVSRVR